MRRYARIGRPAAEMKPSRVLRQKGFYVGGRGHGGLRAAPRYGDGRGGTGKARRCPWVKIGLRAFELRSGVSVGKKHGSFRVIQKAKKDRYCIGAAVVCRTDSGRILTAGG